MLPPFPICKVPALTNVFPRYLLSANNTATPDPTLFNPPLPFTTPSTVNDAPWLISNRTSPSKLTGTFTT